MKKILQTLAHWEKHPSSPKVYKVTSESPHLESLFPSSSSAPASHTHTRTCTHTNVHAHTCTHMYTCTCTCTHTGTHSHTHAHECTHMVPFPRHDHVSLAWWNMYLKGVFFVWGRGLSRILSQQFCKGKNLQTVTFAKQKGQGRLGI